MYVAFTGTRKGVTAAQLAGLEELLLALDTDLMLHGNAVGADEAASHVARGLGLGLHAFPSVLKQGRGVADTWEQPAPPLERNRRMVDHADAVVAVPAGRVEEQRSGTWATVRYARQRGKPVYIIYPDGEISRPEEGPSR